ncbi:MAG: hypothetical protein EHM72_17910 [Calditrichaeota bacterium]|nr:MAG: hypothetical protein EHM72_17910 [Calditrichota bacterium]
MDTTDQTFSRKLSGEESEKRFIIVPKERAGFFPKPGVSFKLLIDGNEIETALRPVEMPNQRSGQGRSSYHLDLSKHINLFRPRFGQMIMIEKVDDQFKLRLL